MKLYQYPKCSTCKKAERFLKQAELSFASIHLVEETPTVTDLKDLWIRSGLELRKFFNTSGRVYREGGFKERLVEMSDDEKLQALAENGMLIKRPILDAGGTVLVGFRESAYQSLLER